MDIAVKTSYESNDVISHQLKKRKSFENGNNSSVFVVQVSTTDRPSRRIVGSGKFPIPIVRKT